MDYVELIRKKYNDRINEGQKWDEATYFGSKDFPELSYEEFYEMKRILSAYGYITNSLRSLSLHPDFARQILNK